MKKYYVQPISHVGNEIINHMQEASKQGPDEYECFEGKAFKSQKLIPVREIPESWALLIHKSGFEGDSIYFLEEIRTKKEKRNFRKIRGKKLFPKGKVIVKDLDDKKIKEVKNRLEELKKQKKKK